MERIHRIADMERAFQSALALMQQAPASPLPLDQLRPLIAKLDAYYSSPQWLADFEADEQGLLPQDLPRGVLSEDGVYNLLMAYRNLLLATETRGISP